MKNNWNHNLGGPYAAVMGGYMFYPGLFHLVGVPHNMWLPEDFPSDLLVLYIVIHRNFKTLIHMDRSKSGVCFTLYLMRLCVYSVS